MNKKWGTSLITDFTTPVVEREVPELYYLAVQWGDHMVVRERPLGREGEGLPPATFERFGIKYKLLCSELKMKKGN